MEDRKPTTELDQQQEQGCEAFMKERWKARLWEAVEKRHPRLALEVETQAMNEKGKERDRALVLSCCRSTDFRGPVKGGSFAEEAFNRLFADQYNTEQLLKEAEEALSWIRNECSPPTHGTIDDMPTINACWEVSDKALAKLRSRKP